MIYIYIYTYIFFVYIYKWVVKACMHNFFIHSYGCMYGYICVYTYMDVCMEVVGNTWCARLAQILFILYTLLIFGNMLSKIAVTILYY